MSIADRFLGRPERADVYYWARHWVSDALQAFIHGRQILHPSSLVPPSVVRDAHFEMNVWDIWKPFREVIRHDFEGIVLLTSADAFHISDSISEVWMPVWAQLADNGVPSLHGVLNFEDRVIVPFGMMELAIRQWLEIEDAAPALGLLLKKLEKNDIPPGPVFLAAIRILSE
jgi:hypothetical protein